MSDSLSLHLLAERLDSFGRRVDDLRDIARTYAPTATQVAVIGSELHDLRGELERLEKAIDGDIQRLEKNLGKLEDKSDSATKQLVTAVATAVVVYIGARLTGRGP